ncbi:hypothetical protein XA26_45850 [Mycolicibacterium fortuitum]|uniref:Recombinase domain-containing protein n=1 Tax=Mycolicibacterium fortuitum TaxID=1766 RepID=A0A0N9YAJ0_MYCFO|nr:recombinase family protein [Mycolicibacterium fortuitum]ALI28385.1 hypothetical protein XA26_45850 [Mycolicibacterium fortuitum]
MSVLQGPQKVSHIAQIEAATNWAESQGYDVVGTIEDLGVSASVSPFDRPDLGPWLDTQREGDWDALVFSKLDRLFRSTRDCVKFAEWAEEHRKILVFSEDGLTLNYRNPDKGSIEQMMAELFVYLGSFFAQLELNRFKARAKDSHRVLRGMDRWASGVPPLGFRVVDHPSGKGKGLDTDPVGKAILEDMAAKLVDGWSFIRIAQDLNQRKIPTNLDKARMAKGKEPYSNPWNVGTVIESLTSERTQGLKMTKTGKKFTTVLDEDGEPIRMAPPTFDADTWRQIQEAAAKRQQNRRTPTETANPMLGVGFCGVCGASLAQQFSRKRKANGDQVEYRYYRCGRTPVNCKGVFMRADEADQALAEGFLFSHGAEPVTRRRFIAGEDHTEDLEKTNRTIESLREDRALGLFTTPEDEARYRQQMTALVAKRDRLAAEPRRAAQWVVEETGQTFAEVWEDSDQRQLLADAGVRFVLSSKTDWSIETLNMRPDHPVFLEPPDDVLGVGGTA